MPYKSCVDLCGATVNLYCLCYLLEEAIVAKHKKPSKQYQKVIAEESTTQRLKHQISRLRQLPEDFRDIAPGTKDWEDFAEITGRRKEMEAWCAGPALCLAPLSSSEERVLSSPNELREFKGPGALECLSEENWAEVMQFAENTMCSWIYLPNESRGFVNALNVLLSRFGYNVRAKPQLMSERTGKPLGVVY